MDHSRCYCRRACWPALSRMVGSSSRWGARGHRGEFRLPTIPAYYANTSHARLGLTNNHQRSGSSGKLLGREDMGAKKIVPRTSRGHMFFLQFAVSQGGQEGAGIEKQFAKFDPLFREIANSLVLSGEY